MPSWALRDSSGEHACLACTSPGSGPHAAERRKRKPGLSASKLAGTVRHPPPEHLLTANSQATLILALDTAVSNQAKYISQCIDEIKQELKQDNIAVKANAVCKLTYVSASSVASPAYLSIIYPSDIAAVRSTRFMQSPA